MRTVDAVPRSRGTNILSKTDTNETLRIRFPVKAWLDAYPDCVIQVIHRRSQDPDGLPAAVLETDGVYAYWLITDSDTAYAGDGEAELRMQSGTAVSKSETYDTHVVKSVGSGTGPAPEPVERVAEQIAASAAEAVAAKNIAVSAKETAVDAKDESVTAANRAEAAAEAAETASTHGPTISEDGTWLVWDAEQGQYVDTGVIAEGHDGQDGADGISPEVTFSTIEGGHSMTVTDAEHPDGQTISIMNGADGEVPIDDTTPSTEKVYSSAKVASEVSTLNQAKADKTDMPSYVKNAMSSTTDPAWTDAEKMAAQVRIGADSIWKNGALKYELVSSTTLEEDISSFRYDMPTGKKYRHAIVAISSPSALGTGTSEVNFVFSNGRVVKSYFGSKKMSIVKCDVFGGICVAESWNSDYSYAHTTMNVAKRPSDYDYTQFADDAYLSYINSTSQALVAGTKVTVVCAE